MAGHVQVIKLVAEVTLIADASEEVQQELGRTDGNQNANCERRKRRTTALRA
jgi:hypothetical protein